MKIHLFTYALTAVIFAGCAFEGQVEEQSSVKSFQTKIEGKNVYLLTHYDVLENASESSKLEVPFGKESTLTSEDLTILKSSFKSVGQCTYKVSSDRPLQMSTPDEFRAMLSEAKLISNEQKYVPLDQVHGALQGMSEVYGHRMPWYYNYLAMGASFVLLNGMLDIATHDAQEQAIKQATEYRQQAADLLKQSKKLNIDQTLDLSGQLIEPNEQTKKALRQALELGQEHKEMMRFNLKQEDMIIQVAQAEHKMEQLFGKFIYFGRETKIFGKTVNLNPLWALKQYSGSKLVPVVKKYCRGQVSIVCVGVIVISIGSIVGAVVPFTTFWVQEANALLPSKTKQEALDDLVGDWDSLRYFTQVKPADMKKLEAKLRRLSKKGSQDCPKPESLVDHYINPKTGRFY